MRSPHRALLMLLLVSACGEVIPSTTDGPIDAPIDTIEDAPDGSDAIDGPVDGDAGCMPQGGDVCGLIPQCGCGAGQKCTFDGSNAVCVTAGAVAPGQTCSAEVQCAPGSSCAAFYGVYRCSTFCLRSDPAQSCMGMGSGSLCLFTTARPDLGVCSQPCDTAASSSAACASSEQCKPTLRSLSEGYCLVPGSGGAGVACSDDHGCGGKMFCNRGSAAQGLCRGLCDPSMPSTPCSIGQPCPNRCSIPESTCKPIASTPSLGFCVQSCDPFAASQQCFFNTHDCKLVSNNGEGHCTNRGTTGAGGACATDADCAEDLGCRSGACRAFCDASHACTTGTCQMGSGTTGWCI